MLDDLKAAEKVVGIKQLRKALAAGKAKTVFIAEDADPLLTEPIVRQCRESDVTVVFVATMQQLGTACSIPVPAAAAAMI